MVDVRETDLKTGVTTERDFTPDEIAARAAAVTAQAQQAVVDANTQRVEQLDRVDNDPLIKALIEELEALSPGAVARIKSRI